MNRALVNKLPVTRVAPDCAKRHCCEVLVLQIEYWRVGKRIDAFDFDNVVLHRNDLAPAHGYQVWPHWCVRSEHASFRVVFVAAGMHLKNGAFFGCVVPVKPVQYPECRELFQPQQ